MWEKVLWSDKSEMKPFVLNIKKELYSILPKSPQLNMVAAQPRWEAFLLHGKKTCSGFRVKGKMASMNNRTVLKENLL